jgi:2-oxoglutarate dehydrogenase complex dehydrogenase (E1) component-like enzyme
MEEESLIPALEQIIKISGQSQVKEVKIGMSHRGRLNVLANVLQKSYKKIFNELLENLELHQMKEQETLSII